MVRLSESGRLGALVALPGILGVGKIIEIKPPLAVVRLFHSLSEHEDREFQMSELRRAHLSPGTRVYVNGDWGGAKIGRVVNFERRDDGSLVYEVRFPNQQSNEFHEADLSVRCWRSRGDPAEILAARIGESQWLHDRRLAATRAIVESQAGAKGMTGLLSSSIELVPHQIAAVRRILCDPHQRYLLADEVGLGKTIEAGVVIRQCLLDDPSRYVVVLAPKSLVSQWNAELAGRFGLKPGTSAVDVLSHQDLTLVRKPPDLLVVDEAHHLADGTDGYAQAIAELAHAAPRLLLLSATPALSDARTFLFLLTLLDREAYQTEQPEAFDELLASRREVGRLLLGLNAEGSSIVLRRRAQQAAQMFPGDPVVVELSARLQEASRTPGGATTDLARDLRTHVAETYRLNQRIVRGRRSDTAGWEFQPRGARSEENGVPALTHLRVEVDEDRRAADLASTLEDWRTRALDALRPGASPELRSRLANRFREFVEALGVSIETFEQALDRAEVELFSGEQEITQAFREVLRASPGERTRLDVIEDCLHRLHKSIAQASQGNARCKILAFSSSTEVARAVEARMTYGVVGEVFLLTAQDAPTRVSKTLLEFERSDTAWLLVLDRAGEEGLNLSFADAMVQLDLPFSPARVEQRIGRIDRFGRRKAAIRQRILVPFDDEGSLWSAWQSLLAQTLKVYNEPISDVQFLLAGIERELTEAMFDRGARGIDSLAGLLSERLRNERQAQDEQNALDRFALADDLADGIASSIEDVEANEEDYRQSIEPWLVQALQLGRTFPQPSNRDVFSLRFERDTLVPRDPWEREFGLDEPIQFAWKRRTSLGRPGLQLVRPGSRMLDACERFMRWDDRGTTFFTWRVDADAPDADEPWVAFRVCVAIEPRMPQRQDLFTKADALGAWRRSQQFLATTYHVLHVDPDGSLIEDRRKLDVLTRPYEQHPSGGRTDINVGSRLHLLKRVMDPGELIDLCGRVSRSAIQRLLAASEVQATISAAADQARQDADRRSQRQRARAGWARSGLSYDEETAINEEIVAAVSDPSVRLDAIGMFIVSRTAPGGADGTE
jgi:ATP-dependent helicase HepA